MAKKNYAPRQEEETRQEEPAVTIPQPRKISFNAWYVMREKRIPAQHMKEIIWADFKARGLSDSETVETFDSALAVYGVAL